MPAKTGRSTSPDKKREYGRVKWERGVDMDHTLDSLEGRFCGKVVKIMKRKCQGGRRVLE